MALIEGRNNPQTATHQKMDNELERRDFRNSESAQYFPNAVAVKPFAVSSMQLQFLPGPERT